jgi:trehalose-6-phosphatase
MTQVILSMGEHIRIITELCSEYDHRYAMLSCKKCKPLRDGSPFGLI